MKAKECFGITFYLNDEEFRYIPSKEILKAAEEALLKRKNWKHRLAFETFKASLKAWNVKRQEISIWNIWLNCMLGITTRLPCKRSKMMVPKMMS